MSGPAVKVAVAGLDAASGGGGASIVTVAGRLDSATVPTVQDAILDPIRRRQGVVYDLGALTYISAAGVRLIVAAVRQAETLDARVAFARVPPDVAETLTVSGFAMFLSLFETCEEAAAHVRDGGT